MIKRKRQIEKKKTEGSTRLTQVILTMTFFFFLLSSLIKQMGQAGSRVNIESTLVYPFDFYFTSILITSLIFTLVWIYVNKVDTFSRINFMQLS